MDTMEMEDGSSQQTQTTTSTTTTSTTEMVDITGLTTETIDKMSNAISGESILKIPSQAKAYIVIDEEEQEQELNNSNSQSSSSIPGGYKSQKHLYIPEESVSLIEIE